MSTPCIRHLKVKSEIYRTQLGRYRSLLLAHSVAPLLQQQFSPAATSIVVEGLGFSLGSIGAVPRPTLVLDSLG
jgi:hypothetical protein